MSRSYLSTNAPAPAIRNTAGVSRRGTGKGICLIVVLAAMAVSGCHAARHRPSQNSNGGPGIDGELRPPPANKNAPPAIPDAMLRAIGAIPTPKPSDEAHGIIVPDQNLRMSPGRHWAFPFTVPTDRRTCLLSGQWSAIRIAGADGTDLKVMVLDDSDYGRFKNGEKVHPYYDSGRASTDLFRVDLHPGQYCLVFYNPEATDRAVNAVVHLSKE